MDRTVRAQQLAILLRIGEEIDIVGDASVTVSNPSELIAWTHALEDPKVCAWRSQVSGHRFVHVTAVNATAPIHGRATACLEADNHEAFWKALVDGDLANGEERLITVAELSEAWTAAPLEV